MSKYSIEEFIAKTSQKEDLHSFFDLESSKMLEINLNQEMAWIKLGKMVAYQGSVTFEREGILEQGLGRLLKKQFTGEGTTLMKANGTGRVYVADSAKQISIIDLTDDTLIVNGNDLLAMASSLKWDIKMTRKMSSLLAGGLFNVEISGSGPVALTSHGDPLTLAVTPEKPVCTDPNATIAWSSGLNINFKTNLSLGSFVGRGSGESIQMEFTGNGFVIIQPHEEIYQTTSA